MQYNYSQMNDEYVIKLIKEGDAAAQDYLINKYKNFVRIKTRTYFLMGADQEDIIQEGMIGLFKAIRDYRPDMHSKFHSFAGLCVTRQIITAVKTAARQKHLPLNSYISLNMLHHAFDAPAERSNPEYILIGRENNNYIKKHLSERLSKLENDVLYLYMSGNTYVEIANITKKDEKSIDNAIQRVRRKLEKILIVKA